MDPAERAAGLEGLAGVIGQLDGFEIPSGAWEPDVLAARCEEYDPALLDLLCLTGRVAWARLSAPASRARGAPEETGTATGRAGPRPLRSTPVALCLRAHLEDWRALAAPGPRPALSSSAREVLAVLEVRGPSFFTDLVAGSGLLATQVEQALAELAAAGLVTSDGFTGLRALITPSDRRKPLGGATRRHRTVPFGIEGAGRWVLLGMGPGEPREEQRRVELLARTLLQRYGIVFRRLLLRETVRPPWLELLQVYRRLEARGEIRGGRFVAGLSGEQFALPEAVPRLRALRRAAGTGTQGEGLVVISAADPLNLTGVVTPGERVPALATNRIAYRRGVPVAAREAGVVRWFQDLPPAERLEIERALARKRISPALRTYLGAAG